MTEKPGKSRRVAWAAAIALLIAGGTGLAFMPWRDKAAHQVEAMLAAQGYRDVHLAVSRLGPYGAALKDISIGAGGPLKIRNLTVGYSTQSMQAGAFDYVMMNGLSIRMEQKNGVWNVQNLRNPPPDDALALPVSRQDVGALRFGSLKLEDGRVTVAAPPWQMDIPVALEFRRAPETVFSARFDDMRYARPGLAVGAKAGIEAKLDTEAKNWDGKWRIDGLTITGGDTLPPPLAGSGTVKAAADRMIFTGDLASRDKSWRTAFTLDLSLAPDGKSELKIASASMPWENGALSLRNASIPLGGSAPARLNVQVRGVSVDQLLQSMTGKRVSATGAVSGTLPVVINRDGSVSLAQGNLKSDGPGTISMPPDAVPGDNAQVETLRTVLKDFHYSGLSIAVSNEAGNKLSLLVTLEGSNPGAYGGHPVKLNVHLAGDVLDFIRQNVMFLTDPKALLQQGQP